MIFSVRSSWSELSSAKRHRQANTAPHEISARNVHWCAAYRIFRYGGDDGQYADSAMRRSRFSRFSCFWISLSCARRPDSQLGVPASTISAARTAWRCRRMARVRRQSALFRGRERREEMVLRSSSIVLSNYCTTSTFLLGLGIFTGTSMTFGYRFSPSSKIGENSPVLIDTRTM